MKLTSTSLSKETLSINNNNDNVKVQNKFHGRNNITCSTDCK